MTIARQTYLRMMKELIDDAKQKAAVYPVDIKRHSANYWRYSVVIPGDYSDNYPLVGIARGTKASVLSMVRRMVQKRYMDLNGSYPHFYGFSCGKSNRAKDWFDSPYED